MAASAQLPRHLQHDPATKGMPHQPIGPVHLHAQKRLHVAGRRLFGRQLRRLLAIEATRLEAMHGHLGPQGLDQGQEAGHGGAGARHAEHGLGHIGATRLQAQHGGGLHLHAAQGWSGHGLCGPCICLQQQGVQSRCHIRHHGVAQQVRMVGIQFDHLNHAISLMTQPGLGARWRLILSDPGIKECDGGMDGSWLVCLHGVGQGLASTDALADHVRIQFWRQPALGLSRHEQVAE